MSECYSSLALVYDDMMSYVPYDNWVLTINYVVENYFTLEKPSIFEIGGGTGTLGARLSYEGYEYTGSDVSPEMCEVAWAKGLDMICTDCRAISLKEKYDLLLFLFDGINYLENLADYAETFISVATIVRTDGYFLFDVTTEVNSLTNFDDYHEAESFERGAYIRHSYYEPENHRQVNDFEIFVQDANNSQSYSRVSEQHCQTLFSVEQIKATIPLDLFDIVAIWDGFSQDDVHDTSERVHFLLKRKA